MTHTRQNPLSRTGFRRGGAFLLTVALLGFGVSQPRAQYQTRQVVPQQYGQPQPVYQQPYQTQPVIVSQTVNQPTANQPVINQTTVNRPAANQPTLAPPQDGRPHYGTQPQPMEAVPMQPFGMQATGNRQVSAVQQLPPARAATSYSPADLTEPFRQRMDRMIAEKPGVEQRHGQLLRERYDLANRPAQGVTMSRGKAVQEGVRVKLPQGVPSWEQLAALPPEEIRKQGLWPQGFLPLAFPKHAAGGMLFPQFHIDRIKQQDNRDLTRFDLDYDLPDHFLPEYPPALYLTTRPDLGDVSQGQVVSIANYNELFNGILNPKQLEGLRLLVTPFPQQQFNATEDRNCVNPSFGVTCFDCHVNGHSNGATHLVGDIRPQEYRHRLDTPPLRGVYAQRLFGSQRALRSIEDFTEFEQRAAYFDGDPVMATKKGVNVLDRGSQVHFMAEFQAILDFPPAPKLDVFGRLDPKLATEAELRGELVFNGRGRCAECHPAPYYTDNTMHNMKTERFFEPQMHNDHMAIGDGPIKTFPLRGIKDSAPYWHDGRLLTLEDTVEMHNLLLGTKLTAEEKRDLTLFLRCL